jgi:hypothetical protein
MVTLSDANAICSAPVLGRILGITDRHVRELNRAGVLKCCRTKSKGLHFRLDENVQLYQQHRDRDRAKGDTAYELARTTRMEHEAERTGLLLKELRGELYRGEDILSVLTQRLGETRAQLLGIPSRCAGQLVGEQSRQKIHDTLTAEIETGLRRVSEIRGDDFGRQSRKRMKAASNGKGNE